MSQSDTSPQLTLIVVGDAQVEQQQAEAEGYEELGPITWLRRKVAAKKEVNLSEIHTQLEDVQGQISTLLEKIGDPPAGRFALQEVEVGLAVSAEGSIGVATVGAEVSLSLTFARVDPKKQ